MKEHWYQEYMPNDSVPPSAMGIDSLYRSSCLKQEKTIIKYYIVSDTYKLLASTECPVVFSSKTYLSHNVFADLHSSK